MYNFFMGWYMKCQSATQTLAVIPAIHQNGKKRTCSIQIITEENTWNLSFPQELFEQFRGKRGNEALFIGDNIFHKKGMSLFIHTPNLKVEGQIKYSRLTPLKYDIMGPFVFVPFMECRHKVFSMCHRVNGNIQINGKNYIFRNAIGYWEGDSGTSFPKEYLWTQCHFKDGSVMLSVAEIPLWNINFTGIIGIVYWRGKEYRFATYLGAKVRKLKNGQVQIVQKNMELEIKLLEKTQKALKAPALGDMIRTIHESAACRAYYRFNKCGRTVFEFETDRAAFEYEYKE